MKKKLASSPTSFSSIIILEVFFPINPPLTFCKKTLLSLRLFATRTPFPAARLSNFITNGNLKDLILLIASAALLNSFHFAVFIFEMSQIFFVKILDDSSLVLS